MSSLNETFERWLREEQTRAATAPSGGERISSVYKRAADAMRKYPNPLSSAKDAIAVKGIGPGIVRMLQQRLDTMDVPPVAEDGRGPATAVDGPPRVEADPKPAQKKTKKTTTATRKASSKEYVPRYRSAGWAIMITLRAASKEAEAAGEPGGYLSKAELVKKSQEHCDAPLDAPGPSGTMYTGWSSMSTLLEKELVNKCGFPPRFCLSEEGKSLADKMIAGHKMAALVVENSPTKGLCKEDHFVDGLPKPLKNWFDGTPSVAKFGERSVNSTASVHKVIDLDDDFNSQVGLFFWYLKSETERVSDQRDALVSWMGELKTFMVEFQKGDDVSMTASIVETVETKNGVTYGFLPESDDLPTTSPGFRIARKKNAAAADNFTRTHTEASRPLSNSKIGASSSHTFKQPNPVPSVRQGAANSSADMTSIVLPAGSFEVVLIVDNREVKSGTERDYFQQGFVERGVLFETRSLPLGDCLWIARPKNRNQAVYHEVVLDHVVERKTLDDLVSSIKDNRFKEQKFRLCECGVRNVIYLIEETSTAMAETFGMEAIHTVMTQCQVDEGFFLKRTISAEETLDYFVTITASLKSKYAGKALEAVSLSTATSGNSKPEWFHRRRSGGAPPPYRITYEDFGRLNVKTKNFTLRDVWTRQLMTLPGISAEKAVVISNRFPSGSSLMKALSACSDDDEREAMLQGLGGTGRKSIGPAIAKKILSVFWRA